MSLERKCPECGTVLAEGSSGGLCLKCLLQVGGEIGEESCELRHEGSTLQAGPNADSLPLAGQPMAFHRFGDYELLEEIARGGMGVVYRARQISLDRIVAVKMLLAGSLAGKNFIQRFRTEAAAAASLQHPNIVAIHEVGFARGQHFFAMDYVEGLTLAQLVARGPLPGRAAATYLKTIAEAIHFAHERNVLHRDLKPSNILIDSATNHPRVTDFGLAKRLEADTDLTLSGQMLGSPNYMPPEQIMAKRGAVSRRGDVYSLGAILYHCLTGRPPFQGETLTDILHQVVNADPLGPRLLSPRISSDLDTICLKCLEKEPGRRYQTAQELADDLNHFLHDEPIQARATGQLEKAWRWCRRKPALASLATSLAAVFVLGFCGTLWQWRHAVRYAKEEAKQHQLADENRAHAEENRERADQNLYDSDMSLAQHTWDDGDLGGTLRLLEAHRLRAGEKDRRSFEWYYFRNLCEGDPHVTLSGHHQAVDCVTFSPDGKLLATGSVGDPVQIRTAATGKMLRTFPEPNVVSLVFSPDGRLLGVGGQDQMTVWDLESGRPIFKHEDALGRFRLAFSPKGTFLLVGTHPPLLRFGQDGGRTELWDYRANELKHTFPESGAYVALSPSGNRLATANWNGSTKIWDLETLQLIRTLKIGGISAMALSLEDRILATTSSDAEVKVWNVASGNPIASLKGSEDSTLAFSPDGKFLVTGGSDQIVRLWDVATAREIGQLRGHGGEVTSVDFSSDGQTVASGSKDKTAMLWKIHPRRQPVAVWNVVSRPVFSPDGKLVAAGIEKDKVVAWDVATLKEKAVFVGAAEPVAFSDNGRALITRSANYFLRTFDVDTQIARETILDGPLREPSSHAALSPDGRLLAIGGANGKLTFCNAMTGVVIAEAAHAFASNIFQIAFSPNGNFLAATGREIEAGRSPTAKVWNAATHERVAILVGHTDVVLGAAFSPDGQILATCGADNAIRFWDTTSWKEIPPSLGQKNIVRSLAYSPNGKTLASASFDGKLKLWNVATRREVASLNFKAGADVLAFSPTGQTLLAGGGGIQFWRAPMPTKQDKPSEE